MPEQTIAFGEISRQRDNATIAGGQLNLASSALSGIAGGDDNSASG